MERNISNIRKLVKIKNEKIRNTMVSKDVGYIIKKAKFGYVRHMIRLDREKWSKRLYECIPYAFKRKKGRPTVRWREEIAEKAGILVPRNKQKWRKIGEAYAREKEDKQ